MGILTEMREKQRALKSKEIEEKDEIKTFRDFQYSQPALSERISEELFSAVHRAVGLASMCWEKPSNAGTFDYIQAGNIAFELCHKIADEIEAARDGEAGYIESTVPTPTVLFKGYETRR